MTVRRVPVYFEFGNFRGRGFSRSTYSKKMHPWSFYGCKVTDWSTVTLTFNFPPGVLACDLEGAHFSQERRLDLSMTIILRNHFCVESHSVIDPLKLQLTMDTVARLCRVLHRTIVDVTECNSQVDALNTSVKWPVTCATITHRLMLVRPV